MGIKVNVAEQDKALMSSLLTECHVLTNLLKERRAILEVKGKEILATNALSSKLYNLRMNPGKDIWEAELKQSPIVLPGGQFSKS